MKKSQGEETKVKDSLCPFILETVKRKTSSQQLFFLINLKCQRKLAQFNELHQTGNENKIELKGPGRITDQFSFWLEKIGLENQTASDRK